MTKMSVDPDFAKGASRRNDIEAIKAGKAKPAGSRLPGWVSDFFNLALSCSIGGACAWVAIKWLT